MAGLQSLGSPWQLGVDAPWGLAGQAPPPLQPWPCWPWQGAPPLGLAWVLVHERGPTLPAPTSLTLEPLPAALTQQFSDSLVRATIAPIQAPQLHAQ